MSNKVIEHFDKPIGSAANRRKFRFFSNASLVCKYITKECFVNGYLLKRAVWMSFFSDKELLARFNTFLGCMILFRPLPRLYNAVLRTMTSELKFFRKKNLYARFQLTSITNYSVRQKHFGKGNNNWFESHFLLFFLVLSN